MKKGVVAAFALLVILAFFIKPFLIRGKAAFEEPKNSALSIPKNVKSNGTSSALSRSSTARPEELALDPGISFEQRRKAVFELTQTRSADAIAALAQLAQSPVSTLEQGEKALRVMALEALDQRAEEGTPVQAELQQVLQVQTHPTIRTFAQISLAGIAQGRPGKLHRFIDQALSSQGK